MKEFRENKDFEGHVRKKDCYNVQGEGGVFEPLLTLEQLNFKVSRLYETLYFCLFLGFTTLELVILMGIMFKSPLFSYCYWSFSVFSVKKDESFANNPNIEQYPNCNYKELHPECLNLCEFVSNIENAGNWAVAGLLIHGTVTLIVLCLHTLTYSRIHNSISFQILPKYLFLTFHTCLFCSLIWVFQSGSLNIPNVDPHLSRTSTPKDLEANLGTLTSICLSLFMIFYRLLLTFLINLTPN